jgi:hypothetical protein
MQHFKLVFDTQQDGSFTASPSSTSVRGWDPFDKRFKATIWNGDPHVSLTLIKGLHFRLLVRVSSSYICACPGCVHLVGPTWQPGFTTLQRISNWVILFGPWFLFSCETLNFVTVVADHIDLSGKQVKCPKYFGLTSQSSEIESFEKSLLPDRLSSSKSPSRSRKPIQ